MTLNIWDNISAESIDNYSEVWNYEATCDCIIIIDASTNYGSTKPSGIKILTNSRLYDKKNNQDYSTIAISESSQNYLDIRAYASLIINKGAIIKIEQKVLNLGKMIGTVRYVTIPCNVN